MSSDLAGSYEHVSPGFDPAPQGLTPALQLAWDEALRRVQCAENNTAHTFALGYAMGMAGGWLRAGLIDSPTNDALCAEPALGDPYERA
ncbi:hypothetical protein [Pseudomonas veronii]|uniref:hypothetical protein n=1 Tax=Pseudomonas veronii TaxID=76761 RepID=UPI000F81ED81|nr:hypothetical protein [Pseudomonas veronii]RTY73536.1 hypothetical protein EKA83_20605 [Pseudomonas veronii]